MTPTFQNLSPSHLSSPLHFWSLNGTASHPHQTKILKDKILCADTCSFQDALPQGCRCAEREEGVWGHGDFNVLNSHFMMSLFYIPRHSVKRTLVLSWLHFILHEVKRCFSALWFMGLLLISSPLLQIWLRACRWTGSLYLYFVLSLHIPPLQFFSSSIQSAPFLPQKGMKLQPSHPGAGWGEHKNSYIEKRLEPEERKQKETTCSCTK